MYHEILHVLVFTKDESLAAILREVPALEHFEHVFLPISSDFSALDCADADVVILDVPPEQLPQNMRQVCASAAPRLVYCERDGQCLPAPLLEEMDAVWAAPFDAPRLQFFFNRLLREVKQRKDLWLSQNLLDTTIDSVPDLVWFKDVKGAHRKVNQSFCGMVGKTKEQCRNRGHYYIWDIDAEAYAKGEFVCLESENVVMQKKKTCVFDEKIQTKNGTMKQFTTYKSPIFDEDGALIGTMGVAHDVTDWKNMKSEIRILLDSLTYPALLIDKTDTIFMVNPEAKAMFHREKEELVGKQYADWKGTELGISQPLRRGEHQELTYACGGTAKALDMSEEPIFDVAQQLVGTFVLFRDVTEHKNHMALMTNYQRQLESEVRLKTRTINDMQKRILISFADLVTSRDSATGDHIRNTSLYVDILLDELCREGVVPALNNGELCQNISRAVPLHDIGKIAIPDAVLQKQGKYTPQEYTLMRRHAELGRRILAKTLAPLEDFKYYKVASDMAAYHHERWDGNGYPQGLKGEAIPLPARIMALADVFDSLVAHRSFHPTHTVDQAYVIIKAGAGTQFDPVLTAAFIMARPQIEKCVQENVYQMK